MSNMSALAVTILMTLASCADQSQLPIDGGRVLHRKSIASADSSQHEPDHSVSCIQLQGATSSLSEDAATYIRWARTSFELGDYGQAIVWADEAVKLTPENKDALSIMAVSALRVSKYAMDGLKPALSRKRGKVSEAKAIAELLRNVVGEKKLVPDARKDLTR